jgi:hypothetical protein
MIDVYAPEGAFSREKAAELLQRLAECFLKWTDAADIPIARENTGAFLHLLSPPNVTAGGRPSAAVRVDVRVPEVVLSTIERRRGFIAEVTALLGALSDGVADGPRAWVTISNTADGGWGIGGRAMTNAELDEI